MCLHNSFAEVQTQPKTAAIIRYFMFAAVKFIKYFFFFHVADALAGVSNFDFRHPVLAFSTDTNQGVRRCVFQCIVHKIDDDLYDQLYIYPYHQ